MENSEEMYSAGGDTNTIFDIALRYIQLKYKLRFNDTSLEFEIALEKENNWSVLNLNSLFIELQQAGINISSKNLEVLIKSHLIEHYNPIAEYFYHLPIWDGLDYIGKLASYVKTTQDTAFRIQFEKWVTRVVLCALKPGYVNKQALVFVNTEQNTGKTTFMRFLAPESLQTYYSENVSLDKDGNIALCTNLIINADELAVFSKSDINSLKAFISKSSVNIRLPYGKKAERMERICSFIGSTNRTDFLTDSTGNVRWLVFKVLAIDFRYSKEIDMDKVWAQAYYNAFERENYVPEMTFDEIQENEQRNQEFLLLPPEQELIMKLFEPSDHREDFLTATDVLLVLREVYGITANNRRIGRALTALNFERAKHPQLQIYGYKIKRKK